MLMNQPFIVIVAISCSTNMPTLLQQHTLERDAAFDKAMADGLLTWKDYGCDGANECCGNCSGDRLCDDKIKSFQAEWDKKLMERVVKFLKGKLLEEKADFIEFGLQNTEGKIDELSSLISELESDNK